MPSPHLLGSGMQVEGWLVMPRFTQPEAEQAMLHKLKLALPSQPPPRIKTRVEFAPEALRL